MCNIVHRVVRSHPPHLRTAQYDPQDCGAGAWMWQMHLVAVCAPAGEKPANDNLVSLNERPGDGA